MAMINHNKTHGYQIIWEDATKGKGRAGRRSVGCKVHPKKHEQAFQAADLNQNQRAVFFNGATNKTQRELLRKCYQYLELAKAKEALAAGGYGRSSRYGTSFFELLDNYLESRKDLATVRANSGNGEKGKSQLTINADVTAIEKMKKWAKEKSLSQITTGELTKTTLESFRNWLLSSKSKRDKKKSISISTANKNLTHIRIAINALFDNQGAQPYFRVGRAMLLKGLASETQKKKLPKRFSPDELAKFCKCLEAHDLKKTIEVKGREGCKDYEIPLPRARTPLMPWFVLLAMTGVRSHEAASLKWENVDFKLNSLMVRSRKTGERLVPLTDHTTPVSEAMVNILTEWRSAAPKAVYVMPANGADKTPKFPRRQWKAVREECGISITPQTLRSNWTAYMISSGKSIAATALFAGHQIDTCQKHYLSFAWDRLEGETMEEVMGLQELFSRYQARLSD